MATRQQLEQMINNPNVRQMLDLIANAEGVKHGYNTLFGNERFDNLSTHPNISKAFTQTDGKRNTTTAAGRYQFLNPTWRGLASQLGLSDFSPKNQDIAAVALLEQNGALPYVLKGDLKTAVQKSGGTWASLPSSKYAQPKKTWAQLGQSTNTPAQQTERYLSQEQISKVLPQLAKNTEQSRYLSQEQISSVLPQLSNAQTRQSQRYLSAEQIAQVLPQLAKG